MERALASIQKILEVKEIPNADRIEEAVVLGWHLVVGKGEFKAGEKCVYFEIDSMLPLIPAFEFLKDKMKQYECGGWFCRLRTKKLRGVLSQGLALPLGTFGLDQNLPLGEDVSERLGIKKYEPQIPATLRGVVKGNFPTLYIPKTDEIRIQSIPEILDEIRGKVVYVTEKADGCLSYLTRIKTDNGDLQLGRIVNKKLKVNILSYNKEFDICEYKPILSYHKYERKDKFIGICAGAKGKGNRRKYIYCTPNHKFYTKRGWIPAEELIIDDTIFHFSKNISSAFEEMLLGCLLGDSSIYGRENYRSIAFGHCEKQKSYFEYKRKLIGNLFIYKGIYKSGYGSIMHRGLLKTNLSILNLIKKYCLVNNKKEITKQWCDRLTPISLAFWYMDDGTLSTFKKQKGRIRIATNAFSYEEVCLLVEALKRFGLHDVSIGDKKKYRGYILSFSKAGTDKFCSLVAPYICESMKYKLLPNYKNYKCCFSGESSFASFDSIIETKILDIVEKKYNSYDKFCYDLTIKDNPNYFSQSILLHNSSATYFIREEFGVCSRNLELKEDDKVAYWVWAKKNEIKDILRSLHKNIAFQGELCIRKGSKIPTDKGIIDIEKVSDFDAVFVDRKLPIVKKYANGRKQCFNLQTKHGFELSLTNDHYVYRIFDNKLSKIKVKFLKEGDHICLFKSCWPPMEYQKLSYIRIDDEYSSRRKEVKLPTYLNEDFAYLLGILYAEGCIFPKYNDDRFTNRISITIGEHETELKYKITNIVKNCFEINIKWQKPQHGAVRGYIYSTIIFDFLNQNDLLKQKSKFIEFPQLLFCSPESVVLSFICGFADGDGYIQGHRIRIKSSSAIFLKAMQLLLLYIGIFSSVKNLTLTIAHDELKNKLDYFSDVIKIRNLRKQKRNYHKYSINIKEYLKNNRNIKKIFWDVNNGIYRQPYLTKTNLEKILNLNLLNPEEREFLDFIYTHIVEEEVKVIQKGEIVDVFDITVDDNRHFYPANGILISNCGPGIQKNRLGLKDFEVFFFNIWDIDERRFFNFAEFCETIDSLGLKQVKVIKIDDLFSEPVFDWTLEELLEMAKGKYEGTNNNREGIVIRPVEETYSEVLRGRLSFKVLNTDYLLKEED